MRAENKVPAIRFKGFSGGWEESTLQSIAEVLDGDRGHNYPNGDDFQATGHTLFLSASNVTANGFKLGVTQYISEEKSNCLGNGKLVLDDIILTSRGSVGHIAWYNAHIEQQVPFARINSGMLILRAKNHIAPSIIVQFLKSPAGKKKIDLISFGSAQPQLTKMSVSAYTVTIPSEKKEQTKIGNYFQQLDTLIAQHQQKQDKLLNLKKALLEKMFPKQGATVPEIRFKGFSGEWEETTLGDFVSNISDGDWIESNHIFEQGEYRIIQTGNLGDDGEYIDKENNAKYFHQKDFDEIKANEIFPRDILISRLAEPAGRTIILPTTGFRMVTAVDVTVIRPDNRFNSIFLKTQLNTTIVLQKVNENVSGTSHKRISRSNLEKTKLLAPQLEEQTKIGNLFQQLDTLITQHQSQLKKLNNIKQACLEKMFV